MTLHTCSECVFELDSDWVDDTKYTFENGELRVAVGPFVPAASFEGKVDKAIETFRLTMPQYELIERGRIDRPAPGAELLAHRFGGMLSRFELSIFWRVEETVWVMRVRGPWDSEELCRHVVARFLETYEPVSTIEAIHE